MHWSKITSAFGFTNIGVNTRLERIITKYGRDLFIETIALYFENLRPWLVKKGVSESGLYIIANSENCPACAFGDELLLDSIADIRELYWVKD